MKSVLGPRNEEQFFQSSILFILSQKFEKALMMAAKIANNIGCFISHKEKKESKTLFLSFPKY